MPANLPPPFAETPAPRALTPLAWVEAVLTPCRARGLAVADLLRQADIAPTLLDQPAARLSASQFERLSDAAMRALDDEALGWFERPLRWGSYGLLARASISAPTLGLALARWCRHHALLTDAVQLRLDVQGEVATLQLRLLRVPPALRAFCAVSLLRNALGLACWWIDSHIALSQAAFDHPAPAHADVYAALFGPALRFDAPTSSLRFSARYLSQPLRRDEAALQRMLRHALPLQVRPYRRDRLLAERVRLWLALNPGESAQQAALALCVSLRSLHRHLAAEGCSWQQLKAQTQIERARTLLRTTDWPIKRIALACGYANDKAFARAFARTCGQPPSVWRAPAPALG